MRIDKIFAGVVHPLVFIAMLLALGSGLSGCTMTEPLATKHLQEEANDPQVSVILLRFRTPQLPSGFLGLVDRNRLTFAVANETTDWNFRQLDPFSMIFRTGNDGTERDPSGASGWVTFLAPRGSSYIAVANSASGADGEGWVATPFPDRISVRYAADQDKSAALMMDFIDVPRFVVQVSEPRSLIYAGTIVRNIKCEAAKNISACPYDLTVVDESELAHRFADRYLKSFGGAASMRTQLLDIPQTRTIEIRDAAPSLQVSH